MERKLVPLRDIVAYWSEREDECGLGVDWAEAHERCWRCAYKSRLQRCHIIPASRGGSGGPDNLVLLCGRCHREAPNVPDSRFMWIWLRATCMSFYDLYWTARGAEEFEEMFGRPPFSGPDFSTGLVSQAQELLGTEISRAVIHWGEGRLNPSTIASIFALVEERLAGLRIAPPSSSAREKRFLRAGGFLAPDERPHS